MSQLPKTLRVPDVERIRDTETREVLRELITELQNQHKQLYNDLRTQEALYFTKDGKRYRITISSNDFVIEQYINQTWTATGWKIKDAS